LLLFVVDGDDGCKMQEQQRLRRDMDNERRARKRLETLLRHSVKSIVDDQQDTGTADS